jgi:hypothetical protein
VSKLLKKAIDLVDLLKNKELTIEEIIAIIGKSERSARRFLKSLRAHAFDVKVYHKGGKFRYLLHVPESMSARTMQKRVAENLVDLEGDKRKHGGIYGILSSRLIVRKPFVVALYGKYNGTTAARFASRLNRRELSRAEIETCRDILQNLITNIEMALIE